MNPGELHDYGHGIDHHQMLQSVHWLTENWYTEKKSCKFVFFFLTGQRNHAPVTCWNCAGRWLWGCWTRSFTLLGPGYPVDMSKLEHFTAKQEMKSTFREAPFKHDCLGAVQCPTAPKPCGLHKDLTVHVTLLRSLSDWQCECLNWIYVIFWDSCEKQTNFTHQWLHAIYQSQRTYSIF